MGGSAALVAKSQHGMTMSLGVGLTVGFGVTLPGCHGNSSAFERPMLLRLRAMVLGPDSHSSSIFHRAP